MSTTFDLGKYIDPLNEGVLSRSSYWVLAVVPFAYENTFDRRNRKSLQLDGSEAAAERETLVITAAQCRQLMISSSKESHVKNLSAMLKRAPTNWLTQIYPGDWLMAWILDDESKAKELVKKLRSQGDKEACNDFDSGLKFVGRVWSIQEVTDVTETGRLTIAYSLQGQAFSEFSTELFWDPNLASQEPLFNTWMGQLGLKINEFLASDGIDVNSAIPQLLDLLLGRGISRDLANPIKNRNNAGVPSDFTPQELDAAQIVTGLVSQGPEDAPLSYVVPKTVLQLLGVTPRSKSSGVGAYADILRHLQGLQKYNNDNATTDEANPSVFEPSELGSLLGRFTPYVPNWSGSSVWSILSSYQNPLMNEMFTCLRVNAEGKIQPNLIVRQLPFSSGTTDAATVNEALGNASLTAEAPSAASVTNFLELPRWKIPASIFMRRSHGRSNALRHNFLHLVAQAQAQVENNNITGQLLRAPPVRDDQDIWRSGLYPEIAVVPTGLDDAKFGPTPWMQIRSDITFGQHLTLTGQISVRGIQAPICEGDNLEFDGVVYHIEGVQHVAMVDGGRKHWMTTLSLSHGVRSDEAKTPTASKIDLESIYPLTDESEGNEALQGFTIETDEDF